MRKSTTAALFSWLRARNEFLAYVNLPQLLLWSKRLTKAMKWVACLFQCFVYQRRVVQLRSPIGFRSDCICVWLAEYFGCQSLQSGDCGFNRLVVLPFAVFAEPLHEIKCSL